MLRAYCYHDGELLQATSFSIEQLERARVKLPKTFKHTDDPNNCDIYWLGFDAGHVEAYHGGARSVADCVRRLPFWKGNESRHVGYFCSDGADPVGLPLIMFRQSFYKHKADQNVVAWPYAVEDFGELATKDFSNLDYDVSFVGSKVSHRSRIESFDSVLMTSELKSFLDDSKLHWGSVEHTMIGEFRKELFIDSLRHSKMILAARGGGLGSYRFFEAMSAGRVPVLFADDLELPHRNVIDWKDCIIQIPEKDANRTGEILWNELQNRGDAGLAAMGQYCRAAWARLVWHGSTSKNGAHFFILFLFFILLHRRFVLVSYQPIGAN